jgi:hypothetical protein
MKPLGIIRIFTFVAILAASTLPGVSFAGSTEACRLPDSKWSQVSLGFPVKKERLKYIAKPRVLVIPFHPSDAPDFSVGPVEKANFIQSAKLINALSSGLSQVEFVFSPTIKIALTTSEMDGYKINAQQTYLKDFENDQFGFALKLIRDADQAIDYTGVDAVVLYGVANQSKQEIASALQYTSDMNFVGNNNLRKDGQPWFTPIVTKEKSISNVMLMYNRSESLVITHELLHNYGLTDLYGAPNTPTGLSLMARLDETLLTYEKWVMGWHPEQDVSCVSGDDSQKISKFIFDTKSREQIALVRPNQSDSMYVLETSVLGNSSLLSFYKLTNDARPPIDYYSFSNGKAGVNLRDSRSIAKNYKGEQYSVLIHSISDSLATVFVYPNSAESSTEVQKLLAEARAESQVVEAKLAAEQRAMQEAEAKVAAELKAQQEAAAKLTAELNARQDVEAKTTLGSKKMTITCIKGKTIKKVTAIKPKCPKGFKKK